MLDLCILPCSYSWVSKGKTEAHTMSVCHCCVPVQQLGGEGWVDSLPAGAKLFPAPQRIWILGLNMVYATVPWASTGEGARACTPITSPHRKQLVRMCRLSVFVLQLLSHCRNNVPSQQPVRWNCLACCGDHTWSICALMIPMVPCGGLTSAWVPKTLSKLQPASPTKWHAWGHSPSHQTNLVSLVTLQSPFIRDSAIRVHAMSNMQSYHLSGNMEREKNYYL